MSLRDKIQRGRRGELFRCFYESHNGCGWVLDDIAVMAELNDSGYIRTGNVVRAEQGQIVAIVVMSITTLGGEYLSQFKKQKEANTSVNGS